MCKASYSVRNLFKSTENTWFSWNGGVKVAMSIRLIVRGVIHS